MTSRKVQRKSGRSAAAVKVSGRTVLTGMASAAAATLVSPASGQTRSTSKAAAEVIVVGAGVFGAWTAWHLRQAGKRVLIARDQRRVAHDSRERQSSTECRVATRHATNLSHQTDCWN